MTKPLIGREKMAMIITDLTLIESDMNIKSFPSSIKFEEAYRFNVFKDYGITVSDYNSSLQFYSENPEEFKKVYDLVLENLSRIQAEMK